MITKDHCITIRVFSNLDLTDPRLAEIALSDKEFSRKEYGKYYDELEAESPIYTQAAYALIDYFDKFQNGLLKPERCNNAEPYTVAEFFERCILFQKD